MDELAEVRVVHDGEVVIATISGEVDISNAEDVKRELVSAVPNSAAGLVVDVSDVGHLDSSGVAILFDLARALQRRLQGACVVAPPTALSSRVLRMTRLDWIVPMVDTVGEGVDRLAAARS
jgi:anti-sigma B factor antagonist